MEVVLSGALPKFSTMNHALAVWLGRPWPVEAFIPVAPVVQPTGPEDINLHVEGGVDGWICCEGQHETDHARLIAKSG